VCLLALGVSGPFGRPDADAAPQAATHEVFVSLGVDPVSLDPLEEEGHGNIELNVEAHLFDTLVFRDDSMKIIPWVAASWTVSPDGATWEFKLRPGIKFQDGEDLDAAAVKYTFDQFLSGNPKVSQIERSWFAPLARADAVDKYTIRLVTKQPYPVLLSYLTSSPPLLPPRNYAQHGLRSDATAFSRAPVGSGPYRLVQWVPDDHLTVEAFPNYWQPGVPAIRRITYRPIPESSTRLAAFLTGNIDLINNVSPEQIPQITARETGRIETAPSVQVIYVALRTDKIPDRRVREALFYATDVQSIIKNIFGGYAYEMKWGSAVTRQEFGFDPHVAPYPYDPQKAKDLLTRAGWVATGGVLQKDGRPLHLTMVTTQGAYARSEEVAQAIAGQWAKVGVQLEVRTREWGVWRQQFFSRKFDEDMFLEGTATRNFDADARLVAMIHSYVNQPGRSFGLLSYYTNPDADRNIEQARTLMDPAKRAAMYREILTQLRADAYQMALYQTADIYAVNKCLAPWKARSDTIIWLGKTSWTCR